MFPKSAEFISHVHVGKSPLKTFGKGKSLHYHSAIQLLCKAEGSKERGSPKKKSLLVSAAPGIKGTRKGMKEKIKRRRGEELIYYWFTVVGSFVCVSV